MNPSYFLPNAYDAGQGPSSRQYDDDSASESDASLSPEPLYPHNPNEHYSHPQPHHFPSHPQQPHEEQRPPLQTGPMVAPHQDLDSFLESFWTRQMDTVEGETPDWKSYNLPLARIKKVMKSDEEVKMISAEAPIMFSKACEIFISELTCRAWLVAESNKRRTLQKSDVAAAIAYSDMFDFLIDIIPRDDGGSGGAGAAGPSGNGQESGTQTGGQGSVAQEDGVEEEEGEGEPYEGTDGGEEGEDLYGEYVQDE
ncbi:hypothetical protein L202_05461 [Cryptococcus amylolentus CBS 6039]|uniref:Core Histone H2A/H2B/H3 domain-containing protein n=2 Tax=Cryptococcus amylolentus TaxID=104669 RepID=A0A1E3HKL5_9TREE|nr:hypothetical protein L202_05461 [Cryptococcus amylolentus CBS 6039]ODN76874.1 hypothetical protein L202_05461 [Cryptococcus amylolentus CBS 6039]ODO04780.1 hypothetical protein I350_05390 [Cryptococcus amylolentus CBS 6273]